MKILQTGDIHIGRSSSRVPEEVPRQELRASTSWDRIVSLAIDEGVGLVCLSGDVADQDNKFWEAIGSLERGINRLAEHSIQTVAVSGNHDFDVLVRLANNLPSEHFRLLGRDGKWERYTIVREGRKILHIDGWSFPQKVVLQSPLEQYRLERDPTLPILGMVHGDLDDPRSRYAPLELDRLKALPPSGWLLGHIHAPRLLESSSWVLYPGSPQALDPGETGRHGAWIVEVEDGRLGLPSQRPVSSIWYGNFTVDVTGVENESDLEGRLLEGLRKYSGQIEAESSGHLVHASLRLCVKGLTPIGMQVESVVQNMQSDLVSRVGNATVGLEKVDVQTMPAINLAEHAESHSALGALARMLLELERPEQSPEITELIRKSQQAMERFDRIKELSNLSQRDVTPLMVREHLRKQGFALMSHLVSQNNE